MIDLQEIDKPKVIELLKLKQSKKKFVVTPIAILKNYDFPVSEHHFILDNKSAISKLKQILAELNEDGILTKRVRKQTYKGIKEIGYDYANAK
ncbi:MAG: hypothetical protein LBE36_02380 [Flavobacteriaceae bacterium]|jgi:hypothetical protein|nr:hypothetical protein [Flavobacteriaceae bacterium]